MKTVFLCVLLFVFFVFGDPGEEKSVSVKEGKNVTLPTDVKQPNETMRWYFNDTLIAQINGKANKSCLYDGEGGIFRDRLKVDFETGSLTITNTTTNHTGRYEAELIRANSAGKIVPLNKPHKCDSTKIYKKSSNSGDTIKTFNVNVNRESLKDSGLSAAAIAGICVVVVLLVAAAVGGVKIYCRRSSRNDVEKNKQEVLLKK